MAVTQKVTLYNNKFTVPPVINAVQNDTDRQVEAYFGDFTLQVGMTGKLSFIRSDGTHYEVSATLNTVANTATAELDQALTQAGVTQAQLKITDSGNVGSTFTFMIKVQPDVAGISVPQDGWSAQEFDQRLTDAENAIDAVEEDVADLQDKEYDYAPVITDTASGAIATFPDGADGYPLKECVVDVDAVQDLHGYDHPWPAGGGMNLLNIAPQSGTVSGINYSVDDDGYITLNGTAGAGCNIFLAEHIAVINSQITLSSNVTIPGGVYTGLVQQNSGTGLLELTPNIKTKTSGDTGIGEESRYRIYITSGTVLNNFKFRIMLNYGASALDYSPYSNICPITGWSEAKVTRTDINVWDEEWERTSINWTTNIFNPDPNGGRISPKNYISVVAGETYYAHLDRANTYCVGYADTSGNNPVIITIMTDNKFTVPNGTNYIKFGVNDSVYGTTYNHDISINYPSTDTAYHQYNGQTFTISLGDTRYGAVLDVTRGKLRVTKYYFKGGWVQYAQNNGYKAYQRQSLPYAKYNVDADNEPMSNTIGAFGSFSSASMKKNIIQPPRQEPISTAYMALQEDADPSDVDLTYLLGTPIEVDLTPTEITTLLGTNNLWSDTGDVEVEYCADTKRYIQKVISQLA